MKKDAVLDTLIPFPGYLLSPRARLPLGLHVSGSLFKICGEFLNRHYGHTALESIINCQTFLAVNTTFEALTDCMIGLAGNVRIVAYQNSYYVSEFMALRQSLSDWIFDYLSKHNITSPCRAWIQPITE